MSLVSNISDVVTQIGVKIKALTGRVTALEASGGAPAGPMNSQFASGTTGSLGTTEAQIGAVTINVVNASSKVLLIARASLTKDTGTTVRTATLRVRAGTKNTDTQVGANVVISSSAVASSAYNGAVAIVGQHAPGAAGNITYTLRGLVGAGASTVSGWELEAVELTGAKGDKGDTGATGSIVVPVNTAQTAAYTFTLADANTCTPFNSATAANFTLPTNASVAFPVGTQLFVRQATTAAVTLVGASGVTVNTPNGGATSAKGDWRCAVKVGTDEWDVL